MEQRIDLLHGKILPSPTGLALPIMATSLVQTAYNLTDMAWIGRVAFVVIGIRGLLTSCLLVLGAEPVFRLAVHPGGECGSPGDQLPGHPGIRADAYVRGTGHRRRLAV